MLLLLLLMMMIMRVVTLTMTTSHEMIRGDVASGNSSVDEVRCYDGLRFTNIRLPARKPSHTDFKQVLRTKAIQLCIKRNLMYGIKILKTTKSCSLLTVTLIFDLSPFNKDYYYYYYYYLENLPSNTHSHDND